VRGAQLLGQEARHRGLPAQRQHAPQRLAGHADRVRRAERQVPVHLGRAGRAQQGVEHLAHRPRFAVADEVGPAGAGRARRQAVEGVEMRLRGVVDVGGVHQVVAAADDAQAARLRARDQPRQDLVVARPPDQPRAQGHRGQRRVVGGQHGLLGDRLGGGVGRLEMLAIGRGFGGPAFHRMGGAVGDAGGGGVDQPADAVGAAGLQHVPRAHHVRLVVAGVTAPGAGLGGVVEYRIKVSRVVAAGERGHHRVAVGQVAAQLAHAQRLQRRVVAAVETGDVVAARHQPAAERLAEEAAAAGDQDLHASSLAGCFAAQAASFSRPILALWRMSTGNCPG
jgi:hypothetical protein